MKKNILPFALLLLSFGWHTSQAQWTNLGSGITATPRVLGVFHPVNENVIWGKTFNHTAFTPAFEFTRTTDGGQTWLPGTLNGVGAAFFTFGIYALDDQTAWIATADELDPISGRIYKTTDGGLNWTHQSTGFTGFNETPAGVWFWNENEGFAYGATCYANYNDQIAAYTTADGGENWVKSTLPTQLPGEGLCLANTGGFFSVAGDNIWFGTNGNRIFRSVDRGLTWDVSSSSFPNETNVASVGFRDSLHGIALSFDPFRISRSTDGGVTWATVPVTVPDNFRGWEVEYVTGTRSTWYLVSSATDYMVSYDDGHTWESHPCNIDAWSVKFLNPKTGFAGSYLGGATVGGLYEWSGPALGNRLFVNDDATGANTGYNWTDAFADLQSALAIAEEGDQIWVAEGTYLPAAPGGSQTSTFLMDKNLQLYGGFVGTESSLSQRGDPAEHPTILSGDLNGDDVEDNFTQFRSDNVLRVMRITNAVTNVALIDGFTIKSGHADGGGEFSYGGGIYCFGAPVVKQCIFTQNFASTSGGGLYFNQNTSQGAQVENCRFERNRAVDWTGGAGMHVRSVQGAGVEVNQSTFDSNNNIANNVDGRGSGLSCYASNIKVTGSSFTNNVNKTQGGALWFWCADFANLSLEVDSCTFEGNESSFGGALYFVVGANAPGAAMILTNSAFNNNSVSPHLTGWDQGGGGICINVAESANASITIDGCLFEGNTSTQNGAGIESYFEGNSAVFNLTNSVFFNNTAANNGSGFLAALYGLGTDLKMSGCHFIDNTATNFSAAADFWGTSGGTGSVVVDSCLFENNTSHYSGALEMGNGYDGGASVNYTLTNSAFNSNEATESGAITLWSDEFSATNFLVDNCVIQNNKADSKGGGIMFNPQSPNYHAVVKNSRIVSNQSPDGGAIDSYLFLTGMPFPAGASCSLENCLISGNISENAVISADSLPNLQFLNCTIAHNQGGGFQLADQSGLILQNTILYNPNFLEYTAATADVTFASNGGNLIYDLSLDGQLTSGDKQNLDPLFAAPGDFHLTAESPCVDAGTNDGVTAALDLEGNARIQGLRVDMGALESEFTTPASEVVTEAGLILSPNPAANFLHIHLPQKTVAPLDVQMFDAQGKLLRRQSLTTGQALELQGLAAGMYSLKVVAGERMFAGKFIKL